MSVNRDSYSNKNDKYNTNIKEYDPDNEAIYVLRTQNLKIQDLYEDLERKEKIIASLQIQMKSMEASKNQSENYKKQITNLEEKLRQSENEANFKTSQLSNQMKNVIINLMKICESEAKLRAQSTNKEKIVNDYINMFNEQEKIINSLKKQLYDKEEVFKNQRNELNEIFSRFKNLKLKLNYKDEEINKIKRESDEKLNELSKEKLIIEGKAKELIEIIKSQSKELTEFDNHFQIIDKEKNQLHKSNEKLKYENDNLLKSYVELKENLLIMKELKVNLTEKESLVDDLRRELEEEKAKNSNLASGYSEISEEIKNLKDKHSGNNSLDFLHLTIENLHVEYSNLKQNFCQLKKYSQVQENKIKEFEIENSNIINHINSELKTIIQWIETYLGIDYDSNNNITELPNTISQLIKNRVKIDCLKESLSISQKKIHQLLNNWELQVNEISKENANIISKNENITLENLELKNQVTDKQNEISKIKQDYEIFLKQIDRKDKDLSSLNENLSIEKENYSKFLIGLLIRFHEILYKMKESNNYDNNWEILDDVKKIPIDQIPDQIEKFLSLYEDLISDNKKNIIQIEDKSKSSLEIEKLKKEIQLMKINHLEETENLLKQKEYSIKENDKLKSEEIRNLEKTYKQIIERMKLKLNESEEKYDLSLNENSFLKGQLCIFDKNLTNLTIIKKDLELNIKKNAENSKETILDLETLNIGLKKEIENKDLKIANLEKLINSKIQENNDTNDKLENSTDEKLKNKKNDESQENYHLSNSLIEKSFKEENEKLEKCDKGQINNEILNSSKFKDDNMDGQNVLTENSINKNENNNNYDCISENKF